MPQGKSGIEKLAWEYLQREVHGRVNGSDVLGCRGKCSRKDKYPYHQQHILVASAFGEYGNLLFKTAALAYAYAVDRSQQKCCGDRYRIEILCDDT